jgi:hypothetical protein
MRCDDDLVRRLVVETLEKGLTERSGTPVRVCAISDEVSGKSSSFAVHRLEARLASGDVLSVVVKDLNPLHQLHDARRLRPLELGRSRREVWVYEKVLPQLGLGTPELYGSRWEPARGALWLLLEDVGPHRLARRLDLAAFAEAAAWLARFHEATAGMSGDARLLRFDRGLSESLAGRLEAGLGRIPGDDRSLVECVLGRYEELLPCVDEMPQGMVHGEFFAKNVLLRPHEPRIAVIDWETAAIGPQYVDLVSITAGQWSESQRMTMRRAYFESLHPTARWGRCHDAAWARFNHDVDVVAVLQAIGWLGFWVLGDPGSAKHASRLQQWMRELRLSVAGFAGTRAPTGLISART